jgi:hypothetical protein
MKFIVAMGALGILTDIGFNYIEGQASEWLPGFLLTYWILGFFAFLLTLRINSFTFKDDYEILLVHSKSFFALSSWEWSHTYHEFPKRKLLGYKIKRFLFLRFLQLNLDSKSGAFDTSKINVTWITSSELEQIEGVLTKVLEDNKKALHEIKP